MLCVFVILQLLFGGKSPFCTAYTDICRGPLSAPCTVGSSERIRRTVCTHMEQFSCVSPGAPQRQHHRQECPHT